MALRQTTRVPAGPGRSGGNPVFHGWRIVAALAVTQTVGYGALYYAFAVLMQPMAADLHASTTVVTGALTASTLVGAVMAIPVGRWLDRHGGRGLMTAGSLAATALLVAWSQVHTVTGLYAVLVGVGLTSAMVLYEPAGDRVS
jgi:MFS family permease